MLLLVDKAAPEEVKTWVRREADHHFGPAGLFEEDDGENWEQATAATTGPIVEAALQPADGLRPRAQAQPTRHAGVPRQRARIRC